MNDTLCKKEHRYWDFFEHFPIDQGGYGRHKCAGCAYENGFLDGTNRRDQLNVDLDNLPLSQAGTVRHKSPHAAYAKGYYDGIVKSYE
jgi:hypothetical protein